MSATPSRIAFLVGPMRSRVVGSMTTASGCRALQIGEDLGFEEPARFEAALHRVGIGTSVRGVGRVVTEVRDDRALLGDVAALVWDTRDVEPQISEWVDGRAGHLVVEPCRQRVGGGAQRLGVLVAFIGVLVSGESL